MRDLISAERFYGANKKKIAIVIVLIALLLGGLLAFPGNLAAPRNARIKKEIETHLTSYSALYQKKDVKGIMALYSNEPDIIMLGAGKENFIGYAAIEKAYEKELSAFDEIISVECKTLSLLIEGDIVTLAAERYVTTFRGDESVILASGFTAVVKNILGKWFFVQTHSSSPYEQPAAS